MQAIILLKFVGLDQRLVIARTAFLESCSALTAHTLDTRGEVHLGDARFPAGNSAVLERSFVAGDDRARLFTEPGVVHGRDEDIDVTRCGFELVAPGLRIAGDTDDGLTFDGPAALRDRLEALVTAYVRPMLQCRALPATPAEWNHQARSCPFVGAVAMTFGGTRVLTMRYGARSFGVLFSSDQLSYAPLGWIPDATAPLTHDEATLPAESTLFVELESLARALGLAAPDVRHRESYTPGVETPLVRGFLLDQLDAGPVHGLVEAAYGCAGVWHLRLARLTSVSGLSESSFVVQDEQGTCLVRGRVLPRAADAAPQRVELHTHGSRRLTDTLLSAMRATLSLVE